MRHKHRVLEYWMLVAMGACEEHRKAFVEVFGYKRAITKKNLMKAHEAGLWVYWFMDHFVGDDKHDEYDKLMREEYYNHTGEIKYDFNAAFERIVDHFMRLFESNANEYCWSEHPFDV